MTKSPGDRVAGKIALVTGAANGLGRAIAQRLAEEGATLVLVDIDSAGTRRDRAADQGRQRQRLEPAADGHHRRRDRRGAGQGAVPAGPRHARPARHPGQRRGRRQHRAYLGSQARGLGLRHQAQPALGFPVHARSDGAHARAPLGQHRQPVLRRARGHAVDRDVHRQLGLCGGQGRHPRPDPQRGAGARGLRRADQCRGARPDRNRAHRPGLPQDRAARVRADPRHADAPHRRPQDIANAVLYLASDEAAYITGTTLAVAGGR